MQRYEFLTTSNPFWIYLLHSAVCLGSCRNYQENSTLGGCVQVDFFPCKFRCQSSGQWSFQGENTCLFWSEPHFTENIAKVCFWSRRKCYSGLLPHWFRCLGVCFFCVLYSFSIPKYFLLLWSIIVVYSYEFNVVSSLLAERRHIEPKATTSLSSDWQAIHWV